MIGTRFKKIHKKIHRLALIAVTGVALTPLGFTLGFTPALAKPTREETGMPMMTPASITQQPYVIGQPLPEGVDYAPVPPRIMVYLGAAPKGYTYGIVGEDILMISLKNKRVMEALSVTP